jgi:hypothetical protein
MSNDDNDNDAKGPQSFGQRHGLTIMVAVMLAMFALVIVVQMLD